MAIIKFECVEPEAFARFTAWVDAAVTKLEGFSERLRAPEPINLLVKKPCSYDNNLGSVEGQPIVTILRTKSYVSMGRTKMVVVVEIVDRCVHLNELVDIPGSYFLKAANLLGKFPG